MYVSFSPALSRQRPIQFISIFFLMAMLLVGTLRAQNVTATVPVGTTPVAVAVNSVTNKIYVAYSPYGGSSYLTVIDGATNSITNIGLGASSSGIAINSVSDKVYISTASSNSLTVIDGATNTITATLSDPAALAPQAIAVNPVTDQIYVANWNSSNVSVFDGATNSYITTLYVGSCDDGCGGPSPFAVAVNPATNKIYVLSLGANSVTSGVGYVTVIDGATNTITATLSDPLAVSPQAMALNPATNQIYIDNSGSVTVIDGTTNNITNLSGVGAVEPSAIAINTVTNKIYVANNTTVSVIDGATNNITNVSVGIEPASIAVNTVTNKIYVGVGLSDYLTVIDGATNNTTTLSDAGSPIAVAVNPATNYIYVANLNNTVTVINGVSNNLSTTTVSADANPQYGGFNVTFTAYVAPKSATGIPTGSVTFSDGWVALGQVPVDSTGHAVYTTSSLTVGSHTITANYWGDSNFSPSSSTLTEQINPAQAVSQTTPPNFSLTANPTPLALQQGQSGTVTISLTGINGYTGTVNLSCGTLPAGLGCSFAPASVTANAAGSAVTSVLTVTSAGPSAMLNKNGARPLFAMYWTMGFGAFGFVLVSGGARRKRLAMIGLVLLSLALVMAMVACGSGSSGSGSSANISSSASGNNSGSTPIGTYNVTVNAVDAASGTPTQSAPLTITVTQ